MLEESGTDLSADDAANAQQQSGPIIHVGQFVVGDQRRDRQHQNKPMSLGVMRILIVQLWQIVL